MILDRKSEISQLYFKGIKILKSANYKVKSLIKFEVTNNLYLKLRIFISLIEKFNLQFQRLL
jgi:hypothetical protein